MWNNKQLLPSTTALVYFWSRRSFPSLSVPLTSTSWMYLSTNTIFQQQHLPSLDDYCSTVMGTHTIGVLSHSLAHPVQSPGSELLTASHIQMPERKISVGKSMEGIYHRPFLDLCFQCLATTVLSQCTAFPGCSTLFPAPCSSSTPLQYNLMPLYCLHQGTKQHTWPLICLPFLTPGNQ